MNGMKVIEHLLNSTQHLVNWFLSDLSDADLLVRPVPGANHLAWQLGHLISGEIHLVTSQLPDATYPGMTSGFMEQYSSKSAGDDDGSHFLSKKQYLEMFNSVREATKKVLARLSDADLDRPTKGDMAKFAPTLGDFMILVSNHTLMHTGQFSVIRRKLGKPVLF